MSTSNIPEIMIISDDEDSEPKPASPARVVNPPSETPNVQEKSVVANSISNDDSDCEITDYVMPSNEKKENSNLTEAESKPKESVAESKPKESLAETTNTRTNTDSEDSDCEIAEIIVIQKNSESVKATTNSSEYLTQNTELKLISADCLKTGEPRENITELKPTSVDSTKSGSTKARPSSKGISNAEPTEPLTKSVEHIGSLEKCVEPKVGPSSEASVKPASKDIEDIFIIDVETADKESADQEMSIVDNTKKSSKTYKCCNTECNVYGSDLIYADPLVRKFYNVNETKKRVHRICTKCNSKVDRFEESLLDLAKHGKSMVEACLDVPNRDTVLLEDSDESEPNTDEEDPGDEMIEVDMDMLDEVIKEVHKNLDLENQVNLADKIISDAVKKLNTEFKEIDRDMKQTQKNLDNLRKQLYQPWNPIYQELKAIDIDMDGSVTPHGQWGEIVDVPPLRTYAVATKSTTSTSRVVAMKKVTQIKQNTNRSNDQLEVVDLGQVVCPRPQEPLPPTGPLERPPPTIGMTVYAMKSTLFAEWLKAKVVDVVTKGSEEVMYRVKFNKTSAYMRLCSAKHLAYVDSPPVQLSVGTRIIAVFHNSEEDSEEHPKDSKDHYYAGIIAEQLKTINNHRYLIFFDDGFTQYVPHSKVCVVINQSRNVWEDCHTECQDFTRTYVTQYPERPMVKLQVGQVVKTEWNTRWWLARVRKVDCSLVLMHFDADNRTEWIYRGSTRLGPLFTEMAKKNERQRKGERSRLHRSFIPTAPRRPNAPYVEYTRGPTTDVADDQSDERRNLSRAVAKKSTAMGSRAPENSTPLRLSDRKENVGIIRTLDLQSVPLRRFPVHQCSISCKGQETFQEGQRNFMNPLLIPLAHGWIREMFPFKQRNHVVFYRAPCMRRLRNMTEVTRFLRITKSQLGVDLFTFDPRVKINTEFQVPNPLFSIKDISYDKENVVIPCVNTINHDYPAYVEYITQRVPTQGVNLVNDASFLLCCECTDGCQNLSKCVCRQLSVQEARVLRPNIEPEKVGYQFGRLLQPETGTAVFECNQSCKCSKTCLNRIAQHPMKVQLQEGKLYGDEYLAELDYIEVMENFKEGYESDVTDIEDDSDSDKTAEIKDSEDSQDGITVKEKDKGSDDEFRVDSSVRSKLGEPTRSMTLRQRSKESKTSERTTSSNDPPPKSRNCVAKKKTGEVRAPRAHTSDGPNKKSIRWWLQRNDDIYVMDAKGMGNIGRYFNHSCDPNVFVQNVFVDTHDPRFPWVAFFTNQIVKAGGELCWNYNYEIDSLPGRRLDCYCETAFCKGRLL